MEFEAFPKIARWKREIVITEKLDGTNAQIAIFELTDETMLEWAKADSYCLFIANAIEPGDSPLALYAGSRNRWAAPEGTVPKLKPDAAGAFVKGTDNFTFARFVSANAAELIKLGPGRHFGEWYGQGIQRGYGLDHKRFALFNTARWGAHNPNTPTCCEVVPVLDFDPEGAMHYLSATGSVAVPGYDKPEGVVMYHTASRTLYKQTFDMDKGKWAAAA